MPNAIIQHTEATLSHWLLDKIVCPVDRTRLELTSDNRLRCSNGHSFPIIDGTPVLFHPTADATFGLMERSRVLAEKAWSGEYRDPFFVDCVGVNDEEKVLIRRLIANGSEIDPVVSVVVGATNGIMYKHLIGKLRAYPFPEIRLPPSLHQEPILDVGCNWGRWTFSAAKLGYHAVGIDPSLGSVMAAKRLARKFGVSAEFVVGDARYLPFAENTFQRVFSYSVLQHFSKDDAQTSLREVGRVLRRGGQSFIQMPNRYGIRCLYHQARRRFQEGVNFDVRYWTPTELISVFAKAIGGSSLSADCFLGIGVQDSDYALMPPALKLVTRLSGMLTRLSKTFPFLVRLADSLYVTSKRV